MDTAHISALQAKHTGLDRRIAAEIARPMPDISLLATLKKQKLRLKEAIASLTRVTDFVSAALAPVVRRARTGSSDKIPAERERWACAPFADR